MYISCVYTVWSGDSIGVAHSQCKLLTIGMFVLEENIIALHVNEAIDATFTSNSFKLNNTMFPQHLGSLVQGMRIQLRRWHSMKKTTKV